MTSSLNEAELKVVKFVQELLLDEEDRSSISPALIAAKIEMVVGMNPKWGEGLNRESITDELIRRFSLWIGQDTLLKSEAGHVQWLSALRKKDWRYWQRYREWLERDLSFRAVEAVDRSSDTILGLLEDPTREGSWDRRGLVVGHVQSGKTGNYTGIICKAADAGYKIIIVLAGLHNNLRSQTQMRLDEGFLGYETKPLQDDIRIIGVGEIDGDPTIRPNYATNRSDKGDFNSAVAKHLGITPEQRPWLFVVKKNATVLKRLHDWIRDHVANTWDQTRARKIVTHLPLLVIDDEADNASVDTGEQVFDGDGNPNEDHKPTVINSRIRQILYSFARSAYLGYTATPFANIFIHERGATRLEGPDLFPSGFIINLAAPSNYVGPAKIFGLKAGESHRGLPLVRQISDHASQNGQTGWMPQKHSSAHVPLWNGQNTMPASLVEAIDSFILTCAIRCNRGQQTEHASMLIHVTRFNAVQRAIYYQVDEYVRQARQRIIRNIDSEDLLARLQVLWERDFLPTTDQVRDMYPDVVPPVNTTWQHIKSVLPNVVQDIQVKMINGTAKDALDYAEAKGTGLKVIAIGGDKLARGLTLEGLSTSYFLRASRMYDTLMQMGRWFGYRPGYLDLCRLYTTSELAEWFAHITEAAEELREEFDLMAASGSTPREYGLKVQSHSVLMVTSRLKMRTARDLMLSFSGQLLETVALYRDKQILEKNIEACRALLSALSSPEVNPERLRNTSRSQWQGYLWRNVPAGDIVTFLRSYRTHPDAYRVNSVLLAEFIESLNQIGELTAWTVVLIGGGQGGHVQITDAIEVKMLQRKAEGSNDKYSIGRLMSPRDESIDLNDAQWEAALKATKEAWHGDPARLRAAAEPDIPSGPAMRKIRGFGAPGLAAQPNKGLLAIYALDPKLAEAGFHDDAPPVVAFGISFPGSNSGVKVEYKVNNVLWEQEYGSAE